MSYPKKILYIWDADYPWDVRVEKICRSLISFGYEVHIASRNLKRKSIYEEDQRLHIHRMKYWNNDRFNYFYSFPAFFSPSWKRFLDVLILQNKIDLIIVRDLPMAIAGIWAGRRHNLPIIFDMAEDYVSMIRDIWSARKFQGINIIVRNPYLASLVESYSLPRFEHIFVVVEEAKRVVTRLGIPNKKITIIGNTPNITNENYSLINNEIYLDDKFLKFKNNFIAIYTGGIQLGRGLQVVIQAIPKIIKIIPNFIFVIIGEGYAVEKLKKIAMDTCVDKYIYWAGWIDHDDLFSYLRLANIGLIPHYRSKHVDTTISNKIFDYMACGLPIVASDSPPMKRIIEKYDAGVVFESGDVDSFISAVSQIYLSQEDYGQNSQNAIKKVFNWKIEEQKLLKIVSDILDSK